MAPSALTLEECEPRSARGLRRGPIPGVGVAIGRRSATADFWTDSAGIAVIRFRTAQVRHWFHLRAVGKRPWQSYSKPALDEFLAWELAEWLCDAIDGEFD